MTQSKSTQNTSTSIFSLSTYICTDFLFIRTTKKEDQTSQSNSTKRFPDIFHVFNYRTPSQKYLVLTLFFLSTCFSSTLLNRTLIGTSQYCEQNFFDFSKYTHWLFFFLFQMLHYFDVYILRQQGFITGVKSRSWLLFSPLWTDTIIIDRSSKICITAIV